MRAGLTHINDETYKFFMQLDQLLSSFETVHKLWPMQVHVNNFLKETLLSDVTLRGLWLNLFASQCLCHVVKIVEMLVCPVICNELTRNENEMMVF